MEYFTYDSYEALGARYGLNDFLFTSVFEGPCLAADQVAAIESFTHNTYDVSALRYREDLNATQFLQYLRAARDEAVPKFLDDCLRIVEETAPTMVGLSCLFDQTIASLALAKLIRERYPEILIVLGGYALQDPVGGHVARCFPFVDVVVQGEAEDRIVQLAEASFDRTRLGGIHGIDYRDTEGRLVRNPRSSVKIDLDDSPFPDFDDFFTDVKELRSEHSITVNVATLPVESSRGCWWGERHHCVFCGIDDEAMKYRYKSPERVERMLECMTERYGDRVFRFSDYILPRSYYKTLFPRLAERPRTFKLHWEMKANVKREEVELMQRAGVVEVQPGIESFSTPVLQRMDKGVTALQNVLTIRMLMQHGMVVHFNILFGFPDDRAEDYRELLRRIPLLYHLFPPATYVPVLTTRYAPLQSDPGRFGLRVRPSADPAYDIIFSKEFRNRVGFDLDEYAYTFRRTYEFASGCRELYDLLVHQVANWAANFAKRDVRLSYAFTESGVTYRDSRYDAVEQIRELGPLHAAVQRLVSDEIRTTNEIKNCLHDVSAARVDGVIQDLDAARLIFREGHRLVGLALPAEWYAGRATALVGDLVAQTQN